MGRTVRSADWCKAAQLWLLAPLVIAGCASTDASKSGSGMQSLGGSTTTSQSSWTDKLTAPFKPGGGATGNRTATANDNDQLSLSNHPNKKNPELIVAIAQMHERAGKFDEAEKHYQKALKLQPKHLGALVGYAHLQDRRNKLEEATTLYQRALVAHPKEAAVQNDLGLCYHRRGMLSEAHAALVQAVALAPERKLYRNNLATVFVEQGQFDAALSELMTAHGQAAGHYNLGYLLAKKGDEARALTHFQQAATLDPTLAAAHQWVAKLSPQTPNTSPALAAPATQGAPVPSVAQRYPIVTEVVGPPKVEYAAPPQPADAPDAQGGGSDRWSAPPSGVRYPNQQTSGFSGAAPLPPTPEQMR